MLKKHLDLFSGIGGFALAARWAGIETIGFCEIDKYAQKVLQKNFPGVPIYEDVTKLNGSEFKDIYLLTGGFPCQDISIAGKGAGIEGERSGLWSELFRIIGEVRPKYALIENVPALTFRGGTRVIGDLTEIGYDTEWQIVGADDVGAPHRRKRIWIVAYPKHSTDRTKGGEERKEESIQGINRETGLPRLPGGTGSNTGDVAYPQGKGSRRAGKSRISESKQSGVDNHKEGNRSEIWGNSTGCGEQDAEDVAYSKSGEFRGKAGNIFKTESRSKEVREIRGQADGVRNSIGNSSEDVAYSNSGLSNRKKEEICTGRNSPDNGSERSRAAEGSIRSSIRGMVDGIPEGLHKDVMWQKEPEDINRVSIGVKDRVQRLKGLGNSICPQVAYEIMKLLK